MNKRIILSIIFLLSVVTGVSAQITIGSDVLPIEGALLDIKQNGNTGANATKGVVFPRVELTSKSSLVPLTIDNAANKNSHKGTVVYNLKETTDLNTGLNVWDGNTWMPVGKQSSAPNFFYLPAFKLELGTTVNATRTINVYTDVYAKQFNSPKAKGFTNPTTIPGIYAQNELYYAVLDYDASVITVQSISDTGLLTYKVNKTTAPSSSYITIVCVVK